MKKVSVVLAFVALTLLLATPGISDARVFVGVHVGVPGFWWPGPWGWGPPYYYYGGPRVIVEQPPVYLQQAPAAAEPQQYWYYCQNPQGYYPYVKQCPQGWMKVVPPSAPPGQ